MNVLAKLFPVIFLAMFILVFCTSFVTVIRELRQWHKNNHSPKLTVNAKIVAKRVNVIRRRRAGSNLHGSYTTYFVTFEVESGDRFELQMQGNEYGVLAIYVIHFVHPCIFRRSNLRWVHVERLVC